MKSIFKILSIVMSVMPGAMWANTLEPDTLLKVETPSKVVITESANGTQISVSSLGDEAVEATIVSEYPKESSVVSRQTTFKDNLMRIIDCKKYQCNTCSGWDFVLDGVCIGLNKAIDQQPAGGLQWSKSFEVSWLDCLGVAYSFGRSAISLGLGFDWRNYKVTTAGKYLVANENKGIEWSDVEEGYRMKNSRLKVFSLQLPLLYRLRIPKTSLYFKCGGIFNFNTYVSLKTTFEDMEGNRIEDFTKNINPRRFTVDVFGSLSICRAVGVYVRYSPMKVMDAVGSLNFRPLTLGICFGI